MNRFTLLVACACALAAGATAYNPNRESLESWSGGYQRRPDPFAVEVSPNLLQQPSQNLFWDKLGLGNSFQGSNQVGGNGWWASMTQKFPFLTSLFSSRMELPPAYGPPSPAYGPPSPAYGPPPPPAVYGAPARVPQPQYFYPVRQYFPPGVQVTDDAVVVSAPGVPPFPAPAPLPAPVPLPAPAPVAPGYDYPRPQYRLELPRPNLK